MATDALNIALHAEKPPEHCDDPKHWRKMVAYQETRARRLLLLSEAQLADKKFVEAKSLVAVSIELYSSVATDTRITGDRKDRGITFCLRAQMLLASVLDELGDLSDAFLSSLSLQCR